MKDGRNGNYVKHRITIEVVSFRPDEVTQKVLRRQFRKKEHVTNKSTFHQRVYTAGMKSMGLV